MTKIGRSKAVVLAAAGALSVATAASGALSSWSAGNAGPGRTADRPAGVTGTAGPLRLAFAAYQQPAAAASRRPPKKPADPVTPTQSPAPTPAQSTSAPAGSGSPQRIAQGLLSSFGWSSSQFTCLNPLWQHESGWSVSAQNAGTGAYGIPQAMPGSRMASAGPDWQTSATTQIKWGLQYIKSTYRSPCAAWAHEQATGWY